MVTVVCARWFDAFPASYVRLLRNAVRDHLSYPHRFVCMTDNPEGLDSDIESVQLPEMGIPTKYKKFGCWPKMGLFAPGVLPPDEPTLFLDLDLLIRGSLTPFIDRLRDKKGLHTLREWNPTLWNALPLHFRPDRGVQSSILGFYPREQYWIYERFMANREAAYKLGLDQDFLTEVVVDRNYWPSDWTVSFKWHCLRYYPLNRLFPRIREPQKAKVVVFHGRPRPIDVVPLGNYRWGTSRKFGFGPVSWVRDYWLRYDESWQEPAVDSSYPNQSGVSTSPVAS